MIGRKVSLKMHMSASDAHYAGELVEGAHIVTVWGDVGTELAIRLFGDESLFLGYSNVRYTAPVYAGDFMEYTGEIIEAGKSHLTCKFEAYKYLEDARDPECELSAANVLKEPVLCAEGTGTLVVKQPLQRFDYADPEFVADYKKAMAAK